MKSGLETMAGLSLQPLEPFGLAVTSPGANLRDVPVSLLRQWTRSNGVVVLRGFSPLTKEEMVQYAGTWGEILTWDFGAVLELLVHERARNYLFTPGNVPLHWDGAFARVVPGFQFFQCLEAPWPGTGGETLFTHTPTVWQRAPASQREEWRKVEISYTTQKVAHYGGQVTVPLLSRHPHTGATTLRFAEELNDESVKLNPLFIEIAGLPADRHAGFLQELREALYAPRVCYVHAWRDGDMLLADNHALLHGRNAFHADSPRHLQRIHII
ncbi:PvcB protein [Cystobacter fuscus DSM 2262]|uniref:PvcB protein n=1 Tax=Cystobacter fuscus (strain ATCC 25194 / DSM 2262 / NBRC 100088 / M29) TaxID=1242864 RepID=S9PHI8_CYSF2|nr:TauD/TfdA family dioxygenase [Cystobacter fuscus]EPX63805.1 PvcB protein [Cystobacter fuscus DSM 2262]